MKKCTKCGKSQLEVGTIVTGVGGAASILSNTAGVMYRPPESGSNLTNVYASTCRNCGHLELYIDPKQV